jgi:uncharacterized protein
MEINTPQVVSTSIAQHTQAHNIDRGSAKPVDSGDRIKTIDIIRGVALCGILLMNIPGFGISWAAFDSIRRGPHNTADYYTDQVIAVFFEGTMRGLFSMLFGAGMILFTQNKTNKPGQATVGELYYRRLFWLTLFGVVNAYIFLWIGDILYFYGLCGMVLYPFRKTAGKWLVVIALGLMAIGALRNQWSYSETRQTRALYLEAIAAEKSNTKLTAEQEEAKASWPSYERRVPVEGFITDHVSQMRSGYGTVFNHYLPWNSSGEAWGMNQWGMWDCVSMMLIGMALFGLGYFSNKCSTSTYLMGLILGYGIGIPVGYVIYHGFDLGTLNYGKYVDAFRVNHQVLYDVKRIFLCLGHASLIMLVFRSRVVPWLMKALANVGQMAFTNYLMQSIICTLFFYGYGLGNYNKLKLHELYYVVGSVWIFQLIASSIWLRYFRFGPFEWLWRSLTYWKKQPMKKEDTSPIVTGFDAPPAI